MKFAELAQAFDSIEKESSRLQMTQMLANLFAQSSEKEVGVIANLSLGQLRPSYQGTQFNFAEKNLISVIALFLGKSEDIIKKLKKGVGDLGAVIAQCEYESPKNSLSIESVYLSLCDIENLSGHGSQEEKSKALLRLFEALDPLSNKYVVRIILGTLRLGFSDMTIVDALSWMEVGDKSLRKKIENAYNISADIGLIATRLKTGGIQALEKMNIMLGVPIRPSAAERMPTAQAIIDKIGSCVAQPKLDGFRLQIHIDGTGEKQKVYFFSRNLIDMSYMFPDLVAELKKLSVKKLIVEGEAIAYDPHTNVFLPFQETVKRKRKHDIDQVAADFPLRVYFFDLLFLDGQEYLSKTHTERRNALLNIMAKMSSDVVKIIDEKKVDTAKELHDYFVEQIDTGLEGLVVKKPDSTYQPGKRNFNWIKFKRHEEGSLDDTIDCVILGYYAGSGKRAVFGIGAFLVGVYNPNTDRFETVAKIGTGLKDDEWRDLKKQCNAIAKKTKPINVECAKELFPDVWVAPEIVCMVRADEITLSPLHVAGKTDDRLGYALRFPRFMGYRPDKAPTDSTNPLELDTLYKSQFSQ